MVSTEAICEIPIIKSGSEVDYFLYELVFDFQLIDDYLDLVTWKIITNGCILTAVPADIVRISKQPLVLISICKQFQFQWSYNYNLSKLMLAKIKHHDYILNSVFNEEPYMLHHCLFVSIYCPV